MRLRALVPLALMLTAPLLSASPAAAGHGGPTAPAAGPLGPTFTYQGRLQTDGTPVNGSCDIAFQLFDDPLTGTQVGETITATVTVIQGVFTAPLDFGAGAFAGQARWLALAVRCGADPAFTLLSPRQPLTAAPYALYAASAPYSGLTGLPAPLGALASPAGCQDAQVPTWSGSTWTCATVSSSVVYSAGAGLVLTGTTFALDPSYTGLPYWKLAGNAGASAANSLGTTDNMTLTLAVSNTAALRLVPTGDTPNVIGGSAGNSVGAGVVGAAIGGGGDLLAGIPNTVTANYGVVGGGLGNTAGSYAASVSGGYFNTASALYATVGGGAYNTASGFMAGVGDGGYNTAGGYNAYVGGGLNNSASGGLATVGGGGSNMASGDEAVVAAGRLNTASGVRTTVSGGYSNTASLWYATVSGGYSNTASSYGTFIGGGYLNVASGQGAVVGGGGWDGTSYQGNTAAGNASAVGGGEGNVVTSTAQYAVLAGGQGNFVSGAGATVGGGQANLASGAAATVPGGYSNSANGADSFAAGTRAHAVHDGAFVWADTSASPISTTATNQFLVRATGGISLTTNDAATTGCSLPAGGGSWNCSSDRSAKANFAAVDGLSLLDALARVPITTWHFKTQAPSIRHIGPMAQDFRAAFGLGENDVTISTVDAQGVALAAIQGLYTLDQQKDTRIAAQDSRIAVLESQVAALRADQAPASASLALPWLLFGALLLLNLGGLLGFLLARAVRARPEGDAGWRAG